MAEQKAPERIWLQRGQAIDPSECTLSHVSTDGNGEVEYVRADLLADAQAENRWQPIKTAPSGKDVLLAWKSGMVSSGHLVVTNGEYVDHWVTEHGYYQGSAAPHHWMPLPDPPSKGESK